MRKLRILFTCLLTVLALGTALAQNIKVKGTVTDAATGEGVPFASIQVKGTMTGTATDGDGNYSIDVPKNATLIFSSIGYLNQEAEVAGRTIINILLASDTENLDEAVITIAYGAAKKSTLTGAISNVDADKIANRPTSTVTSALEGTVTGVQVNSTFGNPGSDPSIMIRGNGTINGSNLPWQFQADLRIDKTFMFNFNKNKTDENGKAKAAKIGYLTVYVDIQNLFNFKNVISVYDYTGNADDDGYLSAAAYQQQINSQVYVPSYVNYYLMRVQNPYNYSRPFRASLGIQFGF